MPDLDLPQLHLMEAVPYLGAVIFYPRAPERHKAFVEEYRNTLVRRYLQTRKPDRIPEDLLPLVVSAASGRTLDITREDARHQFAGGFPRDAMAGLILVYVLACADAGDPSEPAGLEHAYGTISTSGGRRGLNR